MGNTNINSIINNNIGHILINNINFGNKSGNNVINQNNNNHSSLRKFIFTKCSSTNNNIIQKCYIIFKYLNNLIVNISIDVYNINGN